ncbi:MAG: hypothetical protein RR386_01010 [Bacteroidaceae bacterium]
MMQKIKSQNVSRKLLLEQKLISVRSYNACGNSKLETFADIIDYYQQHKTFLNCKNAGLATDKQLIKLCEDYFSGNITLEIPEEEIVEPTEKKIDCCDLFKTFNKYRYELYECYYARELKQLDVRSYNALQNFTAKTFYDEVINKVNYSFISLAYVGKKTVKSLEAFKELLETCIIEIAEKDDDAVFEENTILKYGDIRSTYHLLSYKKTYGHLPMFWILEQRLFNSHDRNMQKMLQKLSVFSETSKESLSKAEAKRRSLNKEKMELLQNSFFSVFGEKSKSFQYLDDWSYCHNLLQNGVLFPSSEALQTELKNEHCHFSLEIAIYILSTVFGKTVELYGGKLTTDAYWNTIFLVRKDLADMYNFRKLKDDFRYFVRIKKSNIDRDLLEVISSSDYYLGDKYLKNEKVLNIAKQMLYEEYNIVVNEDGTYVVQSDLEHKKSNVG